MSHCDSRFVQPPGASGPPVMCPGGHHKFDSCRDEALYLWSLEDPHSSTGDGDFEGHLAVVIVRPDEIYGLGRTDGPDEREVIIPAGNYLVWTASTGAVMVTEADTAEGAWDVLATNQARYALWGAGCNPDDQAGHQDCGDFCRRSWAS